MAYRFNGTSDFVEFAVNPFTGNVFGAGTMAYLVKRTTVSSFDYTVMILTSALADRLILYTDNTNNPDIFKNGSAGSLQVLNSATTWYLIVGTFPAGNSVLGRLHIHDGTSWNHANTATAGLSNISAILSSDRLRVGRANSNGSALVGDLVCAGIKKADSTDLQVETLSPTGFQSWRDFGFDWLIGFDASLKSGGVLQDQASPGTGDEIAISGTTLVADPAGWSWTPLFVTPVADFTGTPLAGNRPLSVAFTDTSINTPTSWLWNFGDGATSTSQNPSHSYTTAGTYTVTLTATNAGGSNTKTRTAYVTVANPSGTITKIKWGTGLVVTDEGGGVIRVDVA